MLQFLRQNNILVISAISILTFFAVFWVSPLFLIVGIVGVLGCLFGAKIISNDRYMLIIILLSILPGMLGRYTTEPRGGTAIMVTDLLVLLFVSVWIFKKIITKEKIVKHILLTLLCLFWIVLLLSWVQGLLVIYNTGILEGNELIVSALYLGRYLFYICIAFITAGTIRTESDIRRWIYILSWIFFGVLIGGFVQRIFWPDFFEFFVKYGWDPHKDRLLGSFFDPNFIGAFIAMNMMVLLASALQDRKYRMWYGFLLLLGMVALGLTLSRSAYLAFVLGFGFLTLLRARWLLVSGFLTIVIIVAMTPTIFERIAQGVSVDDSSQKHVESWETAWDLFQIYPVLGVGYNHLSSVQDDLSLVDEWDVNNRGGFENSFLSVGVYSGVIGLLVFGAFWFAFFGVALRNAYSRLQSNYIRFISSGIAAAIIVCLVSSMLINTLFFAFIVVELWMLLGMMVWIDNKAKDLRK